MKSIEYRTSGTCASVINVSVDEYGVVTKVDFIGGCDGNLQGIGKLVVGMSAADVISRLNGIRCGWKATSCPDQLCRALEKICNL